MPRKQPAHFEVQDASGRTWKVRVGPLGLEATLHRASQPGTLFDWGIVREHWSWRDLLSAGEVCDGG